MEFSKKLLFFSWSMTIILTVLAIVFACKSMEVDPLTVALSCAWAETGTATAFYYWKAKNENRAKYAQKFFQNYTKDLDADTMIRMAEIVLKD